mmetsp:Transcript_126325/g.246328  ORF Transcript_126325/g.246328 Transcript_126325/m.246328 type:complete len:418 (-) Transcript_126325:82-1335(-)
MCGRPFASVASELVDESFHPLEQLEILDVKVADLQGLRDADAVVECRIKQLALHRVLRYLYDFPLQPLIRAEVALAEAYAMGGFHQQARDHLDMAREASDGGIMDDTQCQMLHVDFLLSDGEICIAEGRCDEARKPLTEAVRRCREMFGEADARGERAHRLLGKVARDLGQFPKAITHFTAAHAACCKRVHADSLEAVKLQLQLAEMQHSAQSFTEALRLQEEAIENLEIAGTAADLSDDVEIEGKEEKEDKDVKLKKGEKEEKEEKERVVRLARLRIDAMARLARWLDEQGREHEALTKLKSAEDTVKKALKPDTPRAVDVKRDIALLQLKLGESDTALEYLSEVHYLELRLHGSRSLNVGRTLKALGTVHMVRRHYADAEHCLVQALRIFEIDPVANGLIIRDIHAKLDTIAAMH